MKKKFVFVSVPFLALAFLSSCGSSPAPVSYENNEWYLTGFGSFVTGAINNPSDGIKLTKSDTPNSGFTETFKVEDVDFRVGDSIYIANKNSTYRVFSFDKENSFATKNAYLFEEKGNYSIDILKTGKYTIELNVSGATVQAKISNGTGTTDNLNPTKPSDQTISFFENGDYHAAIDEKGNQVVILKYASFIKEQM